MWSVRKKASYTTKTLEWFGDLRKATFQEFVNSWAMRWIWTHLLGTMWLFYQIRTIYCNDFFSIIITMKKYGMEPLTIAAKLSISVTSVILEYVSVIRDWTMKSLNPPPLQGTILIIKLFLSNYNFHFPSLIWPFFKFCTELSNKLPYAMPVLLSLSIWKGYKKNLKQRPVKLVLSKHLLHLL